jgi:hypothetical protein
MGELAEVSLASCPTQFFEPQLAGATAVMRHPGVSREAQFAIERVSAVLGKDLLDTWEVLLIEQQHEFDHDCRSGNRWLRFHSNARAVTGVAYLIDTSATGSNVGRH